MDKDRRGIRGRWRDRREEERERERERERKREKASGWKSAIESEGR